MSTTPFSEPREWEKCVICDEQNPLPRFESTKRPKLRFRALLTDGTQEVRFERAVMG